MFRSEIALPLSYRGDGKINFGFFGFADLKMRQVNSSMLTSVAVLSKFRNPQFVYPGEICLESIVTGKIETRCLSAGNRPLFSSEPFWTTIAGSLRLPIDDANCSARLWTIKFSASTIGKKSAKRHFGSVYGRIECRLECQDSDARGLPHTPEKKKT